MENIITFFLFFSFILSASFTVTVYSEALENPDEISFKGKVAVIAGASSVGAGVANFLTMLGAQVVMIGGDEKKLNGIIKGIKKNIYNERNQPPKKIPVYIVANLLKEEECKRAIEKTVNDHKRLDILLNIANSIKQKSILEGDISIFDELYTLNVRVPIMLARAAIEPLRESGGNIINMSSIAGKPTHKNLAYYGIIKACLDHFTIIAASEFVDFNIRVNSINVGGKTGGIMQWGTNCDAAYAVAFVASELALYLTGNNIVIHGGGSGATLSWKKIWHSSMGLQNAMNFLYKN